VIVLPEGLRSFETALWYRGYRYDTETGLYYLQSRYYDPVMGRFLNADAIVSSGTSIIGTNMFAYCQNNCVNMVDSSGYNATYNTMMSDSGSNRFNYVDKPIIDYFKNQDGSYSLYDNRRSDPDNIFHEQILSVKLIKPSVSIKNGKYTLGSYKVTFLTGGWEWEYVDLSLLDVGSAKIAAGIHERKFEVTALAAIWDPSIAFKIGKVKIALTANIGSIGGDFNFSTKSFKASGAYGWGAGISVDWE
jgi:RHS repeat-associated protein